jgi:hypothetical protein
MENFRLEGWFLPQETGFFDAMAQLALPISGILSGVDTQEGFRAWTKPCGGG